MKTPDNAIDFDPSVDYKTEAKLAGSPAEQPRLTTEQLDAQHAVPTAVEPNSVDTAKAAKILESLAPKSGIIQPSVTVESLVSNEPQTSHNNPSLREIAEKFAPKEWKPSRHNAAYTPDNIRRNLQDGVDLTKRDVPVGSALLGAGVALAGLVGYGAAVGVFSFPALLAAGAVSLAPVGIIGIPMIAGLGAGGYLCRKAFKAWNNKRKGLKALEKEGFGSASVMA